MPGDVRMGVLMQQLLRRLTYGLCLTLLLAGWTRADDPPPISDAVRKAAIKKLGKDLRKKARSPRAPKYKPDILALLDSLEVLGGVEAGEAALGAVPFVDEEVRDRAFTLAETWPEPELAKPLIAILEDKAYRQDTDARKRAARSLSIVGDPKGMPALTDLMRTDEDPELIAVVADSLATFASAPLPLRKEAVKRLVNTYTSTWNVMMSIRPEDKVIASKMRKHYQIYGRNIRGALEALTGETGIARPQEWREWWNENKKRTDW